MCVNKIIFCVIILKVLKHLKLRTITKNLNITIEKRTYIPIIVNKKSG